MSIQSTDIARQSVIGPVIWRCRVLLLIVIVHFLAVLAACALLGQPFESGTTSTLISLVRVQIPLFLVILLAWRFVWMIIYVRPKRPTAWFAGDLRQALLDPERLLTGIVAFFAMCVFAGTFAVGKDLIPLIVPFSWDPAFAALDRALHFGHDPWRLLFTVTGTPLITTMINAAYHLWLMLAYFLIFVACFNIHKSNKHLIYVVSDAMTWFIGGNILAVVFSSVGPVYYQAFGFGDEFVPLMDTLRGFHQSSPVWALDLQTMLLDGYTNDGPVKGISAMPSMHVASSTTMALYGWSISRRVGILLTLFAATVLVGSVQLGWHYAIDGYFSILIAITCWCISRRLVGRFS